MACKEDKEVEVMLIIGADGDVGSLYQEELDLAELGKSDYVRASDIEPEGDGTWTVLMRTTGEKFTGFPTRSEALAFEHKKAIEDIANAGNVSEVFGNLKSLDKR